MSRSTTCVFGSQLERHYAIVAFCSPPPKQQHAQMELQKQDQLATSWRPVIITKRREIIMVSSTTKRLRMRSWHSSEWKLAERLV